MSKLRMILAAAGVLASGLGTAGAASAQGMLFSTESWYISFDAGVALGGTLSVDGATGSAGFPAFSGKVGFDAGPAGAVAFGAYLTDQVRAELQVGWASQTARTYDITFDGNPTPFTGAASGSVSSAWLMAFAQYDFIDLGGFVPHVSAGAGFANVSTGDLVVFNPTGVTSGNSFVPVGAVGIGADYALSDTLTVSADYTFAFGGRAKLTYDDPANSNTRAITADVKGHVLSAGLRLVF